MTRPRPRHGWHPVVPPRRTSHEPWHYDRELYKQRNQGNGSPGGPSASVASPHRYDKFDAAPLALVFDTLC